jgi:putative endonuclease
MGPMRGESAVTDERKSLGDRGEADAVRFLEERGYRMVDSNVRPFPGMARGEIDLIAWHGEDLVFIEVKTRRTASGSQGAPIEAITPAKQRQMVRLASFYLGRYNLTEVPCRFDVVEVVREPGRPPQFSLIQNAFDATDAWR